MAERVGWKPDLIIVDDASEVSKTTALAVPYRYPDVPTIFFGDATQLEPPRHVEADVYPDGSYRSNRGMGILRRLAGDSRVLKSIGCRNSLFCRLARRNQIDFTLSDKGVGPGGFAK